jgi:hypothetical protein
LKRADNVVPFLLVCQLQQNNLSLAHDMSGGRSR